MLIRKFSVATFAVLSAAIVMSNSLAAEPTSMPYPPEPDPDLVRWIARDLGITPEQVKAHGIKSREAHFNLPVIKQFLGDAWAGGYFHWREDGFSEVVVATTDGRFEQQIKEMGADRMVVVRYSLAELEDAQNRLTPAFRDLAVKRMGLATMGVSLTANRISVGVLRGSEAVVGQLAATANVPVEMLIVEPMDGSPVAAGRTSSDDASRRQ